MSETLVLIGCSSKKRSMAADARMLYQGNLFKLSVRWAESHGLKWAVLSAYYGLVMPEQFIESYELSLADLSLVERKRWGSRVGSKLDEGWPTATFIFLAGEHYFHAVSTFRDRVETPLAGMGIGMKMSWLKRNVKKVTA